MPVEYPGRDAPWVIPMSLKLKSEVMAGCVDENSQHLMVVKARRVDIIETI